MDDEIIIKKLDKSSIKEQIMVYMDAFSIESSYDDVLNMWEKKHYSSPLGISYIFGAYAGDKLVGINAFIPLCYVMNQKKYYCLESANSGVLKSFQGKKIWSKLVKFAIDYFKKDTNYDFRAIIGFPNVTTSYSGFLKMGWKDIFDEKNFIMINNSKKFSMIYSSKIKRLICRFLSIQKTRVKLLSSKKITCSSIEKQEIDYSKRIYSMNKFSLDFSNELLGWKITYNDMECYAIKKDQMLLGYYFVSIKKYFNATYVRLNDVWICNEKYKVKKIICCCINDILKRYNEAAYVRFWAKKDSQIYKCLKKLGFMVAKHRNPFIILPLKNDEDINSQLLNSSFWNTTFMDLD